MSGAILIREERVSRLQPGAAVSASNSGSVDGRRCTAAEKPRDTPLRHLALPVSSLRVVPAKLQQLSV